ncbi:MAG: DNA polymerase IV [Desulfobacterales bacterium]|nr:DNA polymerase IV [Desulfobacterales bacterium]
MILHIDMDAFFAAIEQRDNPHLKGKPVIISGDHSRGVVSTASYEARRFGIRSAMPVFQAKQRCDHLEIIPGNMKKYQTASRQIMAILASFSPSLEPVSIDEAYVDINGSERLFGSPEQIGMAIKNRIYERLSLTCSVGIAPVKFLSKIASDMNKPDGLTIIDQLQMDRFIRDLPIEKVPGVGKQAMKQMRLLKIKTLGDIHHFALPILTKKFGSMGQRLMELSRGIDATRLSENTVRKSISSETTLSADIKDFETVKQVLLDHSQTVGRQLRKKRWVCTVVFIKLKFSDFSQITRQKKLDDPICSSAAIFDEALALYRKIQLSKKIRLVGVGVGGLKDKDAPFQMSLITRESRQKKQWESVDEAVDTIAEKFGTNVIKKASLNRSIQEKKNGKQN